MPHQNK